MLVVEWFRRSRPTGTTFVNKRWEQIESAPPGSLPRSIHYISRPMSSSSISSRHYVPFGPDCVCLSWSRRDPKGGQHQLQSRSPKFHRPKKRVSTSSVPFRDISPLAPFIFQSCPIMSAFLAQLRGYAPVNQQVRQRPWLVLLVIPALLLLVRPWGSTSDLSGDGWDIIARHKVGERLSRGALKQQGARAHVRENLRDDKDYLFTMVGAGWNNQVFQIASCT